MNAAPVDLDAANAGISARYDAILYASRPNPMSSPNRLAAVATLLGRSPAAPREARVLEVGCGDGSNLIPAALVLPGARFVGCDLSARALAAGRATIDALGLRNVELLEQDLSTLPASLGAFDYIVAHGVYSWVPGPVRDALFALAGARLAPQGVMFVSYNTLPGCRVRQAVWDVLQQHVEGIDDPVAALAAARELARVIADGGAAAFAGDDAVRAEFRAIADRPDSALFHDDLGRPNEPVYFRDFIAQAGRHGLAYLGEAELHTMGATGVSDAARRMLSTLDPLRREQYLDFVRLRRFRQTLLRRDDGTPAEFRLRHERLSTMHAYAEAPLLRAAAAGKLDEIVRALNAGQPSKPIHAALERLAARAPASVAVGVLREPFSAAGPSTRPLDAVVADAFAAGIVGLAVDAPPIAAQPGTAPTASALARYQAERREDVTTLLHAPLKLPNPDVRRLLARLDGRRERIALVDEVAQWPGYADRAKAAAFVDHALGQFAKLGLLVA